MANPRTPVAAPSHSPPPVPPFPIVDITTGKYTAVGMEYQQELWASIHGTGGLAEQVGLEENRTRSLIASLEDKVAALEALVNQVAQSGVASLQDRISYLEGVIRQQASVIEECHGTVSRMSLTLDQLDVFALLPPPRSPDFTTAGAFTQGSVLFAGPSGITSEDNVNFFWDDTNDRLGIGGNAPTAPLDIGNATRTGSQSGTIPLTELTRSSSAANGTIVDAFDHLNLTASATGNKIVRQLQATCSHGSGAVATVRAANANVENTGAGSITTGIAYRAGFTISGAGNIDTATCFEANLNATSTGVATNFYGFRMGTISGTIATHGIHIEDPGADNYFAGTVVIDGLTTINDDLDQVLSINGEARHSITNVNAGTGALSKFKLTNASSDGQMILFGTGFTTAGVLRQDGLAIANSGAGGITFVTTANQPIYIAVNSTETAQFLAARFQSNVPVRPMGYTVATLPAGTIGDEAYVTDALAPVFGAAVAGGGAVTVPVYYTGAAWFVG